jgi:Putative prokaryotic signal transducing protein
MKTVTIQTFGSREAAELAASNLRAHGIECWIQADDCGGMLPNLSAAGGVQLLVRDSDTEAALALLSPSE